MIYKLQTNDNLNTVAKRFGYDDHDGPKRFFKAMRYVQGNGFMPGSIIEAPCEPSSPRDRPYDGQPHTDMGVRGKTFVEGLTMRDIVDCLFRAYALSSGEKNPGAYKEADKGEDGELINPWELDLSDTDPVAISQNLTCEIERMMGIFPNVPELKEAK